MPKTKAPYDFEKMKAYAGRFITSTVDLLTGKNVYFEEFRNVDEFFEVCKVANSMPLISKVAYIDNIPMLDGGMADAIPIWKALEEGWSKLVIVLTQDASYRKKPWRI